MSTKVQIDDREFLFDISIGSAVSLTKSAIKYFELNHCLPLNGFVEGYMVVDNTVGSLDNLIRLKGDSFTDVMYIFIQGIEPGGSAIPTPPIEHACSIYKVHGFPGGEYPKDFKKIYFREIGGQALREIKNNVSMENFKKYLNFESEDDIGEKMSDNEKSIRTDIYLREIFKTAGIPVAPEGEHWQKGKYYMPLISPFNNEFLWQTIRKVHSRHIAEEDPYDFCYVYWDAAQKEMRSYRLSKIFKEFVKKSEWRIESFIFGDMGSRQGGGGGKKAIRDVSSEVSVIKAISHEYPNSNILNKNFNNQIPILKTLEANRYNIGSKYLKKYWAKYIEYYVKEIGREPAIEYNDIFKNDSTVTNNLFKSSAKLPNISEDIEFAASFYKTLLFNSHKVTFTCRGMPHRVSGKFADIASIEQTPTLRHEAILGRYWITECKHIFTDDKYWTEMTGYKTAN